MTRRGRGRRGESRRHAGRGRSRKERLADAARGIGGSEERRRRPLSKQAMRVGGKGSYGRDRVGAAVGGAQKCKVDGNVSAAAAELEGDDDDWKFCDDENSGYFSCLDEGTEAEPEVLALIDENQLGPDPKDQTLSIRSPIPCNSEHSSSRSVARQFSPGELNPVNVLIARNSKMAISIDSDSSEDFVSWTRWITGSSNPLKLRPLRNSRACRGALFSPSAQRSCGAGSLKRPRLGECTSAWVSIRTTETNTFHFSIFYFQNYFELKTA